jgi:murein DD-endopeptidase MepM/ murein hydrolase activator NlpD
MIPELNILGLRPGENIKPKELVTKVQAMFTNVMLKAMEDVDGEGLFGINELESFGQPLEERSSAVNGSSKATPEGTTDLPVNGIITSSVGWRRDPLDGTIKFHAGTDIAAPEGTPVTAVAAGRVVESGAKDGYGKTVVIETEDGRKMLYAHNNQNFVQVGAWVSRGDTIAEVGSTGRATGPHVHFEVKF